MTVSREGSDSPSDAGFTLKAVALALTLLPLVLSCCGSAGRPHPTENSAVPALYAALSVVLHLRLAVWFFYGGPPRLTVGWLLGPFWMVVLPASVLVLLLEPQTEEVLRRFAPAFHPPPPNIHDWLEMMRERFEGIPRTVAPREPEAGAFRVTLHFLFAVALPVELLKKFCSLARRGPLPVDRVALAFYAGIGFGVVDAILHSVSHGNGREPFAAHLVRFVSGVGLHAVWAALTVGFSERLSLGPARRFPAGFRALGLLPSVLLHGLFESCVAHEQHWAALLLGCVSVGLFLLMSCGSEHGSLWTAPRVPRWLRTRPRYHRRFPVGPPAPPDCSIAFPAGDNRDDTASATVQPLAPCVTPTGSPTPRRRPAADQARPGKRKRSPSSGPSRRDRYRRRPQRRSVRKGSSPETLPLDLPESKPTPNPLTP